MNHEQWVVTMRAMTKSCAQMYGIRVWVLLAGAVALLGACAPGPAKNTNQNQGNSNTSSNTNDNAVVNGNNQANENGNDNTSVFTWKTVHKELPQALLSVQVVANGDVYAVGSDIVDGTGPLVLRYRGGQWVRLLTGASGALWWVHEVAEDEVWMCGENRLLLRHQPSTGAFEQIDLGTGSQTLFGVWGLHSNDIWTVGGTVNSGIVFRYDGTEWKQISLAEFGIVTGAIFKVWGHVGGEVWMVGSGGRTVRYDGEGFELIRTDSGATLFTVFGSPDGGLVLTVGGAQPGEIWEFDGQVWQEVTPGSPAGINGVHVGTGGQIYAAGVEAATFIRTESGWVPEDNGLTELAPYAFHAIWVDPGGRAWAVGGNLSLNVQGMMAYYGPEDVAGPILEVPPRS